MSNELEKAHQELYDAGMGESEFMKPMQQVYEILENIPNMTDPEMYSSLQKFTLMSVGWGTIWSRPGLEPKQRSLINLALLAFQAKKAELAGHIRGAVKNGASEIEIRETLLHTSVYVRVSSVLRPILPFDEAEYIQCGIPTGMEAFRVADEAVTKLKEEGLLPK
ncbi:AhpD-like protein [Lentinula aff. lateritia]|uniref:AhpD-like protein n=1 Tax=Lentinula aff. lateritia TaxID=2804960 RepID=A0ACC1UGV7_9AGAR|nr:AhpD-like protein [Lentinula aff. lateritia]